MKTKPFSILFRLVLAATLLIGLAKADDKSSASANSVNGVKGVKQEAVESVKKVEPPTIAPTAVTTPAGVNQVDGVNTIQGVKAPGQETTPPPPPAPVDKATQGVNQVEGVKAMTPDAVQPVPPPPAGAVSTIQAVKGVQGIIAPKQRNLEAALLIKEGGEGPPTGTGKGAAAAAALLSGPPGEAPGPPLPDGDGRDAFQEFEIRTAPGS